MNKISNNIQKYIELTKGFNTLMNKNDDQCDVYLDRLDVLWKQMSWAERKYVKLKLGIEK